VTWSRGKYITPKEIEEAFGVKDLAAPEGVYLNQPNPFAKKWREIRWPFLLSLPILFFVWAFTIPREAKLLEAPFVFERTRSTAQSPGNFLAATMETPQTLTSAHFQLDGNQRVEIEANAGVDNGWLDLDMDLVNAKNNETIPAPVEISYYHGYDSDGSWTEGSQNASVALPAVAAGEYFLTIEPSADEKINKLPFTVRVKSGGVFFGNCIVVLLLVLFYPIMLLWRRYLREKERWSESDFSPYTTS